MKVACTVWAGAKGVKASDLSAFLTGMTYSEEYMISLWKKVRKLGGLCTGITQNISDLLNSKNTATLVSNSEYIMLLKQSQAELPLLQSVFNLSDPQAKFLVNRPIGTGIMKYGDKWLPLDNRIPKGYIYDRVNTNLHEKAKTGKLNLTD